jgi:hypothetical protein
VSGIDLKITIELSEFRSRISRAAEQLQLDVREGVLDAARQGIEEARRNHSYQDRTGALSGYTESPDGGATSAEQVTNLPPGEEAADMVWPPFYASFVDKGTSRSRPYPYTPQATEAADRALDTNLARAVENFERNIHK